jgi:hypothetical protein
VREELKDLPAPVAQGLTSFLDSALAIFGAELSSAILYGSAAEGRLRPASDVNLLLILKSFTATQADALRSPFAAAQAAIRLNAMFLLESEVEAAKTCFAQKFSDIVRRHRVLHGSDPFMGAQVPRAAVIQRVRQVLLNLTLRLREAYLESGPWTRRIRQDRGNPLRRPAHLRGHAP